MKRINQLSPEEAELVVLAATHGFPSPIPTQNVSSDEFLPRPQTVRQREFEARIKDMGDELAARQGMSRRRFFQTAAGMAASFVAMNQVFGPLFRATEAEAATPELANQLAESLKGQFIMDTHTHFLQDSVGPEVFGTFKGIRDAWHKLKFNPEMPDRPATDADLKYENYIKEMFLDSDTKVTLISSAPADEKHNWFLSNQEMAEARAKVNAQAGTRRMLSHAIFTPGYDGWLEEIDKAVEVYKPDSWKGYTIDDNIHQKTSRYPWRLDDERLVYPAFEKFQKAGIKIVCIHKGLFPPSAEREVPRLRNFVDVSDVGRAAKDWPELRFVIYHAGYRHAGGGDPAVAIADFKRTGRIDWVTDLGEIPNRWGVSNVYADIGATFAEAVVGDPIMATAILGTLIKGLGPDKVIWGTDSVWFGSPQWQIEALRRLEIPADMQKEHGYSPLGPADGSIKTGIFGENVARLYGYQRKAERRPDRLDLLKAEYEQTGPGRSNLRYGYIHKPV